MNNLLAHADGVPHSFWWMIIALVAIVVVLKVLDRI